MTNEEKTNMLLRLVDNLGEADDGPWGTAQHALLTFIDENMEWKK